MITRAAFAVALTGAACCLDAAGAAAVTFEAASIGGVMQQPTSHYYLAMYGGAVSVATDSERFIATYRYVERPEFRDVGYDDKDYGGFAAIGTKVTKTGLFGAAGQGLYAYLGAGRMAGYTKIDPRIMATSGKTTSSYSVPGLTTLLEYGIHLGALDLTFGHQAFVGYVDNFQLQSYVAWPFNFYDMTLGFRF